MRSSRSHSSFESRVWGYSFGLLVAVALAAGAVAAPSLPSTLTTAEASSLSQELSEPESAFFSDNLVSNELSFVQVLPELASKSATRDAYIGVGPEQNFSFISVLRPRIAFVIDIRRNNLLLHVMYSALFKLAPTRASFVFRLFSRQDAPVDGRTMSATDLMVSVAHAAPVGHEGYQRNLDDLVSRVTLDQPALTSDYVHVISQIYGTFFKFGPQIDYAASTIGKPLGVASYARLMTQTDQAGHVLGFLADDEAYGVVRDLETRNLVIPVTGNVAGGHALRAIGAYLRAHGATVSAFYISNVEQYLGRASGFRNGDWSIFCENVASLPLDPTSVFIRPWGLALVRDDGSTVLDREMTMRSTQGSIVFPAGSHEPVPSASSLIAEQVRSCH